MAPRRTLAVVAAVALSAMSVTACGSSDDDDTDAGGAVTMQFWHNATTGPGKAFWEKTVTDFQNSHANIKIKIQQVQNEDLDGKLQTALNSGSAPDIFLQRGGGKMAAMVEAGQLKDITADITAETKAAVGEAVLGTGQVDGKAYSVPVSILPGGFWYSKDVFQKAGVTTPPATLDDLNQAVTKLKANSTPIALGGKDAWPAAHWYYFFALRACSKAALDAAAKDKNFGDACWTKAGEDLKAFADTKPFNDGFLTTSAQQGAGSSAGLVANYKASMELMGAWDPGVIASLTKDAKPLPDLGFFPFPAVPGGQGDPAALMGGADGYSCSAQAPKQCADFLNYILTKDVQEGYYKAFNALPVSKDAQGAVTEDYLKAVLDAYNKAPYVSQWLDTIYGQNVGNALNVGVVNLLAGKGDVAGIIQAVNDAAKKG
ncbi:raffinose/stachyose/melibiose transport system substrate-binding protein [Actinoplanes lutulentus]|uniref:Carbohydrate ABC transporter substrate-binding protein (CUT1 family) n=1 Tax=Actinoplanes lutulentus TaxID=1287878 RepID=A0A327Z479_9ACTN|nr:extracellular solute-binding protein [Actinoplanes lutulentus]MBB2947049.1 raffinose/stachyose/melibiose transport system substrate-binding protein [Actinoplanes lutulentus]RAK30547.1 carbohydrate ABC transporter substrate-binding protein (CUT1 family) [Actinoplanes lutulentus]